MSLAEYQTQSANATQSAEVSLFDTVDARTSLAGSNKMEILLFSLGTQETFGINVFKVKEVCRAMHITKTPNMPNGVDGIVSLRGHIIPVLTLAKFMGLNGDVPGEQNTMMVAEYSRHILGFLVHKVDRIIRVDWDKVRPAEGMLAGNQEMVGVIDKVEKGLELCVFFVDDSGVARKKISELIDKMGVKHMQANNGREAWERLQGLADATEHSGMGLHDQIQVILVDAEMPEMDGYVLTQHIKADKRFDGIPVVMHSSLSSEANRDMGKRVGVDYYVPKFDADVLANTLRPLLTAK